LGHLVEARGVEPLSEDPPGKASPSAAAALHSLSQASGGGLKALVTCYSHPFTGFDGLVPCSFDTGHPGRRCPGADGYGFTPRLIRKNYCQFVFVQLVDAVAGPRLASRPSGIPVETSTPP